MFCSNAPVSGTESDSDSGLTPEHIASSSAPPPLSAIAEQRRAGEDTEDDEEGTGAWRTADVPRTAGGSDLRAGYLWKKGERRKVRHLQRSQMPSHDVANGVRDGCAFFFCAITSFHHVTQTDLEAAVVRSACCALGLLQDFGRISTAPASRPTGCAYVYARCAQAA